MKISPKFATHVTDKYKTFAMSRGQFPIVDTILTTFCLGLNYFNYLSLGWAIFFAILPMASLTLIPVSRILRSGENLMHGRKKTKAIISIIAITLGATLGGMLGFYLVTSMPVIASVLTLVSSTIPSSLTIALASLVFSTITARILGFSVLWIIPIGTIVAFTPFQIPLAVEAIFLGASVTATLSVVISKQLLRDYYKFRYGRSNADADFEFNYNNTNLETQARLFSVNKQDIKNLNNAVVRISATLKNTKNLSSNAEISNALKDLKYAPLVANDDESINQVQQLFRDCYNTLQKPRPINVNLNKESTGSYKPLCNVALSDIRANPSLNSLYHCHKIESAMANMRVALPTRQYESQRNALKSTLEPFIMASKTLRSKS